MSWKKMLGRLWSQNERNVENIPGYKTQYPGRTSRDLRQQLIIGLDFGTAFTKVVIGETRVSYAVPFSFPCSGDGEYLLPGVLSVGQDGECYLGENSGAIRRVSDLKMRLLQGDFSVSCQAEIAAFLALVFRYCRAWLLNEHRKTYEDRYLDWYINVGLPTDSYHDERLTNVYRSVVQAAWLASVLRGPITVELMQYVIEGRYGLDGESSEEDDNPNSRMIHPDAIGLFPEFVAQVTGYVRSPLRRPDLHALVDVGAGTVDVTVFNVHESDGEDRYPIFAKSVKPLGVQYLVMHRLRESRYDGGWQPEAQDIPPPDLEFAVRVGLSNEAMRKIDYPFRKQVYQQIIDQLSYTKKRRYPKSRRWDDGVPMFLCGGGAKVKFYSQIITSMEEAGRPYKLTRVQLPKPDRLLAEGVSDDGYDRLSVAYGLSFDAFDIGEIQKADEVVDVIDGERTKRSSICSLCNGTGGPRGNDCSRCGGSGMI